MRGTVLTEAPAGEQGGGTRGPSPETFTCCSLALHEPRFRAITILLYSMCASALSGKHSGSHEGLTVRSPRRPSRRPSLLSLGVVCLLSLVSNG